MIVTLADLFAPGDDVRFLDHFASKTLAHLAGNASAIGAIPGLAEINRMLADGTLYPPRIRVSRSGNVVPEDLYCTADGFADAPALEDLMRKGATLVVDNFGPLVPALRQLERTVERAVQARTLINAYLTFRTGGAFAAHYDYHDVLIIQVAGEKDWEVLGPVETPEQSRRKWKPALPRPGEVVWQGRLRAGDMLFLPRGQWHRASVDQGEGSFHLAVTMVSPTGRDYLDWVVSQLEKDNLLGEDIPVPGGEAALAAHSERLRARLIAALEEHGLDRFLEDETGKRVPDAGCMLGTPWTPDPQKPIRTALRRKLHGQERTDGGLDLRVGGQSVRLGPVMHAVLRLIDAAPEGLSPDDLQRRLADRWPAEAVSDALSQLARKGLVMRGPDA